MSGPATGNDAVSSAAIEFLKTEHKKTLDALRREIAELRDKNTDLNFKLTLLQDEAQQSKLHTPETDDVQQARDEERRQLQEQCQQLRQAQDALTHENKVLQAKLTAMHTTIAERDEVIRSMTQEQSGLHSRCAELEQEVQRLRNENTRFSNRQAELVMQLRRANADNAKTRHDTRASTDTQHRSPRGKERCPMPPNQQDMQQGQQQPGPVPASPPADTGAVKPHVPTSSPRPATDSTAASATPSQLHAPVVTEVSPPRDPRHAARSRPRHRRYAPRTTAAVARSADTAYIQRETERLRIASASVQQRRRLGSASYSVVPPISPKEATLSSPPAHHQAQATASRVSSSSPHDPTQAPLPPSSPSASPSAQHAPRRGRRVSRGMWTKSTDGMQAAAQVEDGILQRGSRVGTGSGGGDGGGGEGHKRNVTAVRQLPTPPSQRLHRS